MTELAEAQEVPDGGDCWPHRGQWTILNVSFGYSVGFIVVILGNLQLFTESTVTAVLPVATHPTLSNVGRFLRLWTAIFLANLCGTFFVSALIRGKTIVGPEQLKAALEVSRPVLAHGFPTTLLLATPAGFLIGSIAGIQPNVPAALSFGLILLVTYIVALGAFSHLVVGSAEAWLLMLSREASFSQVVGGFILPAPFGNIIGGSGLFAVVAHGQVRDEISDD